MNFRSIYQHGFARVAACTSHVAIADPPANADAVLRQARACSDEGVAVALFPELCLTGYSIDDLLLQDAVLDGVETAVATIVEGSADLLPVLVFGAPLRHRNRVYNCAVVVHRGRLLGVAPKSYLPTYREFYERRQLAPGDDMRGGEIRLAGAEVPFGPDLLFAAERRPRPRRPRRGVRGHVDPDAAERRGRARGRDGAPQPLGQPDHDRPRRGPQAPLPLGLVALPGRLRLRRGRAGRVDDRPVMGRPDDGLRERGAARRERPLRRRRPADDRRRRRRPPAPGAHADGDVRRQPAHARRARRRVPHGRLHPRPARTTTSASGARSSASRSSPPTPTA